MILEATVLSTHYPQTLTKTNLAETSAKTGLSINTNKTKVMRINTSDDPSNWKDKKT